ncbi:MAG: TonB-dependent receptor, partial [Novosphingobium sp.]|nr:TonB-dependent receptor [Novosphingobium sp.]
MASRVSHLLSSISVASVVAAASVATPALAQDAEGASSSSGFNEIVVTATKREEKLQDVGLTVSALGSEALENRRIENVEDLAKAVPGLAFAPSPNATPVYTMRGVGFFESSIGAYPNVATYIDQAPLPLPVMTSLTAFDLERVEVLKGPQGTLFGNNATGGAINFVAAKPTDSFHAGVKLGYARFNTVDVEGYVSGPVADTLNARLAVKATRGDDWQKSYTRDDTLGEVNRTAARLLLEWKPTDRLTFNLNVNGWRDKSDTQAPALYNDYGPTPTYKRDSEGNFIPGGSIQNGFIPSLGVIAGDVDLFGTPRAAIVDGVPTTIVGSPFSTYPTAPKNPRAADWTPDKRPYSNNKFFQAALRTDFDITDTIQMTSITDYIKYKHLNGTEADGTSFNAIDLVRDWGQIETFAQEVRFASTDNTSPLRWVIGANYERTSADEIIDNTYYDASSAHGGQFQGFTANSYPSFQDMENWAVFGNLEFRVSDLINLRGGIRYTEAERKAVLGNESTPGYIERSPVDFGITNFFNATWQALGSGAGVANLCPGAVANGLTQDAWVYQPVADGESFTLNPNTCQAETFRTKLKENNTSWSLGIDLTPVDNLLIYANVARGFKAGSFPSVSAATTNQFAAVVQEKVTNYEIGFKSTIPDLRMTLNGAVFYNDYRNKQVRSKVVDRIFGFLDALQNVPKSEIKGAEVEMAMSPVDGLNLNFAATYLDTKVKKYIGADPNQFSGDFLSYAPIPLDYKGAKLPFAPKWQISASFDYTVPVTDKWSAMFGAAVSAQTKTIAGLYGADDEVSQHVYRVNGRTLLDLTAAMISEDGWKVTVWGKNVTNKYYWTNAILSFDTNVRYVGRPAEYGV